MWKYPPFLHFLNDLTKFELIDQIIIINNDRAATPAINILAHPKVNWVTFNENIFVNPAWNYGVSIAKNKKICILSDDIIFDLRAFYHVDLVLTDTSGVIGIDINLPVPMTGQIEIRSAGTVRPHSFGCLMFVHKDTWIEIPNSLKVYYGDDWIFNTARIENRQNYLISNLFHYTPEAVTSSYFYHHYEIETPIYHQAIHDYFNKVNHVQ